MSTTGAGGRRGRHGRGDDRALLPPDPGEDRAALAAFASLPSRWQELLHRHAVSGDSADRIARSLEVNLETADIMLERARAGLHTAWLAGRLGDLALAAECTTATTSLVRRDHGDLSEAEVRRVDAHLLACGPCSGTLTAMRLVEVRLVSLLTAGHDAPRAVPPPAPDPMDERASTPAPAADVTGDADGMARGPSQGERGRSALQGLLTVAVLATVAVSGTVLGATGALSPSSLRGLAEEPATAPAAAPLAAPASPARRPPHPATAPGDAPPTVRTVVDDDAEGSPPAASPPGRTADPATAPALPPSPATRPVATAPLTIDALPRRSSSLRPSVSGTAHAGATVRIRDDSGALVALARAAGDGRWDTGVLERLSPLVTTLHATQQRPGALETAPVAVGPFAFVPVVTSPVSVEGESIACPAEGLVTVVTSLWSGTMLSATIDETGESAIIVEEDGAAAVPVRCGDFETMTVRLAYDGSPAAVTIRFTPPW